MRSWIFSLVQHIWKELWEVFCQNRCSTKFHSIKKVIRTRSFKGTCKGTYIWQTYRTVVYIFLKNWNRFEAFWNVKLADARHAILDKTKLLKTQRSFINLISDAVKPYRNTSTSKNFILQSNRKIVFKRLYLSGKAQQFLLGTSYVSVKNIIEIELGFFFDSFSGIADYTYFLLLSMRVYFFKYILTDIWERKKKRKEREKKIYTREKISLYF